MIKYTRLLILGLIIIALCWVLSGCIIGGHNWMIGQGSILREYNLDGSLKKSKVESKLIPDFSFMKVPGGD